MGGSAKQLKSMAKRAEGGDDYFRQSPPPRQHAIVKSNQTRGIRKSPRALRTAHARACQENKPPRLESYWGVKKGGEGVGKVFEEGQGSRGLQRPKHVCGCSTVELGEGAAHGLLAWEDDGREEEEEEEEVGGGGLQVDHYSEKGEEEGGGAAAAVAHRFWEEVRTGGNGGQRYGGG